jgi:predicted dehydrogenase
MIRLGIVDFDTSHAVEFTRRLNHVEIDEEQWVEGAKVVAGVPGTSLIAPETVVKNTETLKKYGITLYNDPADLFGKVDAVLVESVDGSVHLARALPFIERGMPTYVDKPFACSLADALKMVRAAEVKHVPLMSSSSLRYAPEVVAAKEGKGATGSVVGVTTYGPAPLQERNPGLFNYGIHPTEMLFTLMGPGCTRLTCLSTPGAEVTTGVWADGRVASIRGNRAGASSAYGFTVFGSKGVVTQGVSTKFIYRELLKQIVRLFETRQLPIDLRETLEIVAFIEAAKRSADAGGTPVEIKIQENG